MQKERRYDIDWLRVITIGLLLSYHIGIAFQPWGVFIGFIQNTDSMESLWKAMSFLNIWRIPLLFFVSGMGVCFAIRKRNWKELMKERSIRILTPFIFGVLLIVPLHVLIWQKYYHQDLKYIVNMGHLWFLANIFIYVLLLSPVFFYLKKREDGKFVQGLNKIFKTPFGLLSIIPFFILEAVIMNPESFVSYSHTWHGFAIGFLAFLFGFLFVLSGKNFWKSIEKWKSVFLIIALSLFVFRWIQFDLEAPNYLLAIESNMWIFTVFGFAYTYLNKPSKVLNYLSESAYPIYIIHMVFLFASSYLIMPMEISPLIKFILVNVFTFMTCFIMYEFIIRRNKYLRPLFGLKNLAKNQS